MDRKEPVNTGDVNSSDRSEKNSAWLVDSGVLSEISATTRWLILLISVLMIILGIFRGEVAAVFRKASTICLECIGIG